MKLALRFEVHGQPQPRGSKTAVPFGNRYGMKDSNPKSKPWIQQVAQIAAEEAESAGLELIDGPVVLKTVFVFVRPRGHFRTGKKSTMLKLSAPVFPHSKPDLSKVLRAIEDALSKVVYVDDSRIVKHESEKTYGHRAHVEISVYVLPRTFAELEKLELLASAPDESRAAGGIQ